MDELHRLISCRGYRVSEESGKLKVRLGGISNEVVIEKDIPTGLLVVNTSEMRKGLLYGLMLFMGLTIHEHSNGYLSAMIISFSVVGLFGVVLTELKVQKIRELVYQLNKNEST
ncbi:hypothetical protein [Shewanella atlantica]|uniref:hypothetical protein n=1 Tax=Shewanella atlantica TaxID=271099 RepID=UPI0037356E9C